MLGTFLPDEMGLFLQQDNVNDFKSMCTERCLSNKIFIFDANNEYTYSVKILCQIPGHSHICTKKKKKHVS